MSVNVVDIIGGIAAKTSAKVLPKLQLVDGGITGVHYYYGHWVDITQQLLIKDASITLRADRYPAICLQQDIQEEANTKHGISCICSPRIIIATQTRQDAISSERYNETFNPILLPTYNTFIEEMSNSGLFLMKNWKIEHSKTDRLYWGRNGAIGNIVNEFNEYLDCIDLQLKLQIYK